MLCGDGGLHVVGTETVVSVLWRSETVVLALWKSEKAVCAFMTDGSRGRTTPVSWSGRTGAPARKMDLSARRAQNAQEQCLRQVATSNVMMGVAIVFQDSLHRHAVSVKMGTLE